ncbi:SET domain-containing protein [Chlorobium sp. N1]|uniref:SET domain-containing protein n=1 Tax=Chlorobium sp. N1 TaxID=2491138 RepID=UPI00103A836B|nr:SET domain-containing protein [Chlorobium sp. N1]TCD47449.1 SET domain-containing protein-lysine N-methyltransferase [Chlorobium sp. N1]
MSSTTLFVQAIIFILGILTGAAALSMRRRAPGTGGHGKLQVGASSVAGRGVFATKPIGEGEIIERCPVLEVTDRDVGGELLNYVFYGNSEQSRLVVMGYGMLFNHSFEPNVAYWLEESQTGPVLVLYAKRAVAKGEELFYDYGKEWWETRQQAAGVPGGTASA